jgi:hypothetical protein
VSSPASGGTPEWRPGDHETDMSAIGFLPDDVIEAIVDDHPVDPSWAAVTTFVAQLRASGDGPAPRPSRELAALLAGSTALDGALADTAPLLVVTRPVDPDSRAVLTRLDGAPRSNARNGSIKRTTPTRPSRPIDLTGTREGPALRVAGRRRVAKVALGVSLAAAVAGAGTVDILPAAANDAVRSAIEAVTPVRFSDPGEHPKGPDDREPASPGSTSTDDDGSGERPTIADEATGSDHRPDPAAVDEPPGLSGDTGLTRAYETPAEPHAPGTTPAATTPSTVPITDPPDEPGQGQPPGSVPSTVPTPQGTDRRSQPDA